MVKTSQKHTIVHYLYVIARNFTKGALNSALWLVLGVIGLLIFQTRRPPYDMVFGIPLMLIGLGFIGNSLWTTLISIFSLSYNRGACPLCTQPDGVLDRTSK